MTMISVNNKTLNPKINKGVTIGEVMSIILDSHIDKEDVVTGISINGEDLSPEDENNCLDMEIETFSTVDFKVESCLSMAYASLNSCTGYIDNVVSKIHETISLYNENKINEANINFAEVIEVMDLFIQLIARIHKTIKRYHPGHFNNNTTLQSLEIHLLSIMKALVPAKQKNDIIMLSDLLEYELIDNLTQWKIKAIPELKKTQNL